MADYTSLFDGIELKNYINTIVQDSTRLHDSTIRSGAQQALATMMLADNAGKIAHEFGRVATALETLVENDQTSTRDILKTIKENTDPVVKKTPHFQQKN